MDSRDTTPEKPRRPDKEFEIEAEGSTLGRFENFTRRLLGVSRTEVREKEDEWKKERRKRRADNNRKMGQPTDSIWEATMPNIEFDTEWLLPNHPNDPRVCATVEGTERVRCLVAREVFRDWLNVSRPTETAFLPLRPALEDAFKRMIACGDSQPWDDGGVRRRTFLLTSHNFEKYYQQTGR